MLIREWSRLSFSNGRARDSSIHEYTRVLRDAGREPLPGCVRRAVRGSAESKRLLTYPGAVSA